MLIYMGWGTYFIRYAQKNGDPMHEANIKMNYNI